MAENNRFEELVKDFGERIGQPLEADGAMSATFRFGEQEDLGHLQYLERSDSVVMWATVGFLPPDGLAPRRTVRVLQLLDLVPEIHDFTLGAEKGTGRLVATARRPMEGLQAASVHAWVDELTEAVLTVRVELAEAFPVELDDFDPMAVDLGDRGEDEAEDAAETEEEA